jgi:putative tryptophan/tyrosine transport system substrate-binding protein
MLDMRRREFITLLGGTAAAWPLAARAQQTARPVRIGILAFGQDPASPLFNAFRDEMRKLGYIEGQTYILEFRSARGDADRMRNLAAELARLPVDVILADGGTASLAAKQATAAIPIVMAAVGDPVGIGLVESLARPGGNVTGFSILSPELGSKRLALLKEAVPAARLVGVLLNAASPITGAQQLAPIKHAALALDIDLVAGEVQSRDSIATAIDTLVARGISALIVVGDAMFFNERKIIVELVRTNRLPAIYPEREYAEAGGLIAYGPSVPDIFRRAAGYVARILRGEKPGDLPIEQPAKFELVINLNAAKAIGLDVPPTLPLRADEVIE